ncbi:hypothetical protein [uncultured Legionella sp.]|uniref:hypothetical protein n=1 Tax=uncultured Legionella sp. TaxID=210934 RepID=UPI00260F9FFF|nr:hypothetical protein [uncultured Legionella sp.]
MSVVSFTRGFALQRHTPQIPVITYYEAASASSYLQSSNLDMYPKFKTLENLIKKIAIDLYAPEDLITNKSLHVKDYLAIAKPSRPPINFFGQRMNLRTRDLKKDTRQTSKVY